MDTDTLYKISSVHFEGEYLIIKTERETFTWKIAEVSQKLAASSDEEKSNYKISPSGYGIHWPLIDEDISLSGLINQI